MKEDNEGDRFAYGYDAGNIIDGVVKWDSVSGRYGIVDEDDVWFFPDSVLETLRDKKVRFTLISFEAIEDLEKMMKASGTKVEVVVPQSLVKDIDESSN